MNRRSFLQGILAASAAPAVILTPGLLMPVRALAATDARQAEILRRYAALEADRARWERLWSEVADRSVNPPLVVTVHGDIDAPATKALLESLNRNARLLYEAISGEKT